MTLVHSLPASFSSVIGRAIPIPAGTRTMVFFGTSGDGIENNRAPGGPALTVSSGAPVHSANFVSLGQQPQPTPTRNDVIDTAIGNDAAAFAAGLTWACVARTTGNAGNYCTAMSNMTSASGQGQNMDVVGLQQNTNRIINFSGNGARGNIQLVNPVATAWHFIALTDTGGAAPTVQIYEFTEVPAGQVAATPYNPTGRTANAAMTTHFGCLAVEIVTAQGPADVAWGFAAVGVMTQPNLAALATSIRPYLARRGIVM